MDEIWKSVIGYPCYRISNTGIVQSCWKIGCKNIPTDKWRNVAFKVDAKRYLQVSLSDGINKAKTWRVHALVATAFLEKPISDKKLCVRHLDGNPQNNRVDNLAWGTYSQNELDKLTSGTYLIGRGKLIPSQVIEIRKRYKQGDRPAALSNAFSINKSNVFKIVSRTTWRHLP